MQYRKIIAKHCRSIFVADSRKILQGNSHRRSTPRSFALHCSEKLINSLQAVELSVSQQGTSISAFQQPISGGGGSRGIAKERRLPIPARRYYVTDNKVALKGGFFKNFLPLFIVDSNSYYRLLG